MTRSELIEAYEQGRRSFPILRLPDIDLSGLDLTGINFHCSVLTNANFEGANLTGANLTGCDLENANLVNANLTDATLSGAFLPTRLEGVVGKKILTFDGVRDWAYACDGLVKIGPFTNPVDWWLEHGPSFLRAWSYKNPEIQEYMDWIRSVRGQW